jgi:hypothetical protein
VKGSIEDVPTEALRDGLQAALGDQGGRFRRVTILERRPNPYRTSHTLEELQVRVDDDRPVWLVFKSLGRQALAEPARAAKPPFLDDPAREIRTYRHILGPASMGTANLWGALEDEGEGRYWLFLEKVEGRPLWQVGELDAWTLVAQWSAKMHARLAAESDRIGPRARLLRHDASYYRLWLERARRFSDGPALDRVAFRYDDLLDRLLSLPQTVIHGEFYPSNILIQERDRQLRVCPVDWELAAMAPGLIDLAALTAGRWSEEERAALCGAYAEAAGQPKDDMFAALEWCRLFLAIQWLGWSSGWIPPREHAQDWLGEAGRLVETLGL